MRSIISMVAALVFASSLAIAQEQSCTDCHGSHDQLREARSDQERKLESLFVDAERFKMSFHGGQACDECHFGYDEHPHDLEEAETPSCTDCHEDQLEHFSASVHGQEKDGDDRLPVSCTSCHGVHDDFKPENRRSRLHPLNVHLTCGACHFDGDPKTMSREKLREQRYVDDIHGEGILDAGLVVSPNCVTCHGGHDIKPAGDNTSRLHYSRVSETCASCHVTIGEAHARSIHGPDESGAPRGATCTDCHRPHEIRATDGSFRVETNKTCGNCHSLKAITYNQSYHGRVSGFGFGEPVAVCADCHGAHEIQPAKEPTSPVHESNLVSTCGKCHEGAGESFVQFEVHADHDDPDGNFAIYSLKTGMGWLLAFVFIFGGVHVTLWLIRSLIAREWRHRRIDKKNETGRTIRRFRPLYVGLHFSLMTSVTVLGLTGLPLHFAREKWAIEVMKVLGGPGTAGMIHRFAAIVLTVAFFVYIVHIAWRLIVRKEKGLFSGPNTMLPRVQDLKDLTANLRWFFGLGPKPRFDRWTYWEKFDYWAVFWGMLIIGGSGIMLWFPVTASKIVPGWVLNGAEVVHGHEALLALGFLFTVHIFHGNLRPDKFPVDLLFYTGRMTEEEFKRDRPVEYQRAVELGVLEKLYDRPPIRRREIQGMVIAGLAMILGLAMVWAIAATMLF